MYFDPELLQLSRAMTSQSLVKHFLTEGDKFLVSRLSPLADQGGYAVASNYGMSRLQSRVSSGYHLIHQTPTRITHCPHHLPTN